MRIAVAGDFLLGGATRFCVDGDCQRRILRRGLGAEELAVVGHGQPPDAPTQSSSHVGLPGQLAAGQLDCLQRTTAIFVDDFVTTISGVEGYTFATAELSR